MKLHTPYARFDTLGGQFLRRIRRRLQDDCVNIVTYHSVAPADTFMTTGTQLRHDPAEFEKQVDYLAANYEPLSLRELIESIHNHRVPRRGFVITIDDGLADNAKYALPILARRRIPVTIFPITAVIGNVDLAWPHKLAWLISNGHTPRVIAALAANGFPDCPEDDSLEIHVRQNFAEQLPLILESVLHDVGTSGRAIAATQRPYLDHDDITNADPDLVEFGNHTHNHPILSALDEAAQRREIITARDILTSLTGRPPLAIAYPFGLKSHYNAKSREIAQQTGHQAALDCRRRINQRGIDPFELSRKPAPTGSQKAFEMLIEDWPANALLLGGQSR